MGLPVFWKHVPVKWDEMREMRGLLISIAEGPHLYLSLLINVVATSITVSIWFDFPHHESKSPSLRWPWPSCIALRYLSDGQACKGRGQHLVRGHTGDSLASFNGALYISHHTVVGSCTNLSKQTSIYIWGVVFTVLPSVVKSLLCHVVCSVVASLVFRNNSKKVEKLEIEFICKIRQNFGKSSEAHKWGDLSPRRTYLFWVKLYGWLIEIIGSKMPHHEFRTGAPGLKNKSYFFQI